MEPNILPQTSVSKKGSWLWLLSIVVLVVLAAGYYFYSYEHPYNTSYNDLTAYVLKDDKHHAGMIVLKPKQFIWQPTTGLAGARIVQQAPQARFNQTKKISGQQAIIGQMALNSVFTPSGLKSSNAELVDRLMTDTKDQGHQAVVMPLKNYADNLLNPNVAKPVYKLTFGEPVAVQNLSHAWRLDFQASAKTANRNTPDMQGSVIEAFGKNGQYLMAIDTAKVNWQPNQSVWQQIVNSLKIDQ